MEVAPLFSHNFRSEGSYRDPTAIGEIEQAIAVGEVEQAIAKLPRRGDNPQFETLFAEAEADYKKRLDFYNANRVVGGPERPMAPLGAIIDHDGVIQLGSKIAPYDASIFGLEDARRDCRLEMIKIVREVSSSNDDSSW